MYDITASIVLYNNEPARLLETINSFLTTKLRVKLVLIDNSPTHRLRNITDDPRCEYVFNNSNIGFGKAHNLAINKYSSSTYYHLILNPDVYFKGQILETLVSYMNQNSDVGQIMPKILYPDQQIQYSGKLLPSPLMLISRRVLKNWSVFRAINEKYELRHSGYNTIMNVPQHLGCFLLIRVDVLNRVGGFDERFFMYNEDIDLTRRIHQVSKTIFYPYVSIYHHYEKGSHKSIRLLLYHILSSIKYFNKWGWIVDPQRISINNKLLKIH